MTDGPPTAHLVDLHAQLKTSMEAVDGIIDQLDGALGAAKDDWTSKGAHEFSDAWHNGFKPSLAKLCQALAAAGTDVSLQHNQRRGHDELGPVSPPR
jgi:uncharacterized protein YukE